MFYLISYDVATATPAGQKRLRRVARLCENHGIRVQQSVFECSMPTELYLSFKAALSKLNDPEQDSLRIYPMGERMRDKVVHLGKPTGIDPTGPLIL